MSFKTTGVYQGAVLLPQSFPLVRGRYPESYFECWIYLTNTNNYREQDILLLQAGMHLPNTDLIKKHFTSFDQP